MAGAVHATRQSPNRERGQATARVDVLSCETETAVSKIDGSCCDQCSTAPTMADSSSGCRYMVGSPAQDCDIRKGA